MANVKIYILKIVAAAANKQKTERVLRSEKTCAEIAFFERVQQKRETQKKIITV